MEIEPLHILLADDDEADRLLFIDAFAEIAVKTKVKTVNSGLELMDWLTVENSGLPYMLFLDLNMPGKSGLDCLQEIRGSEKLKKILIAIYSTSDSEKDIDDTFFHGANVYIKKPENFNMLRDTLQRVVAAASIYKNSTLNRENFILKTG